MRDNSIVYKFLHYQVDCERKNRKLSDLYILIKSLLILGLHDRDIAKG